MHETTELLGAWDSFYVMIGSSAAALTGLMFVVITLVSDTKRGASEAGISVFSTPTVVHFCCALLTSAVMSAPFRSFVPIAVILTIAGIAGVGYVLRTAHNTSQLETYTSDSEDIVFHVVLPLIAYLAIAGGALVLHLAPRDALFVPAGAVTLLIFVGIHNAWDLVTFLALGKIEELPDSEKDGS